ncbi:hypothetical protein CPB83DRAFT_886932 [Crepidotus variabilis]|uniref:F-box domain-containing protein n=1 Tax=Crepidotus variabilis TaxID=179855 RepID=A0A9P6E6B4_9AGAR|nr:hypothetical protein CPB83DRAFT_886932 [Crepidotus variabilis]
MSAKRQIRAFKNSPTSLTSLPPELLIEILKASDWRDVLQVRKTCITLNQITRAKSLWQYFLGGQSEKHAVPWSALEKPAEHYSASEIEWIFLRWKSVEISLRKDSCSPLREHRIRLPSSVDTAHFLTGGRWILVLTETGAVYYCDLEATKIKPTLLIPCPFNAPGTIDSLMSVDESRDTALLSFNIAIFTEDWKKAEASIRSQIAVYRVTLVLDSQHNSTGFAVTCLSTFHPGHLRATVISIELRGPHIARLIRPDPPLELLNYIEVFDWKLLNGSESKMTTKRNIICHADIRSLRLLPDSRIMVYNGVCVLMLDLLKFSESTHPPELPQPDATFPSLWSMVAITQDIMFSSVFTHSDKPHIIFYIAGAIMGVTWASGNSTLPKIEVLPLSIRPTFETLRQSPEFSYHMGTTWSRRRRKLVFIRFNWPGEALDSESGVTYCDMKNSWGSSLLPMEVASGRLAYRSNSFLHVAQLGSLT